MPDVSGETFAPIARIPPSLFHDRLSIASRSLLHCFPGARADKKEFTGIYGQLKGNLRAVGRKRKSEVYQRFPGVRVNLRDI